MVAPSGVQGAAPKPEDYYHMRRGELFAFIDETGIPIGKRVLNVGCAAGADADSWRQRGVEHLTGIEPVADAAAEATERYDTVLNSTLEEWEPAAGESFDLIQFGDSLEHMPDAVLALQRAYAWLVPGGHMVISVPNIRHVTVLFGLVARGDFRYQRAGIMDQTHLRYFTSKSMRRLLTETGLEVVAQRRYGDLALTRAIERTFAGTGEFLLSQTFTIAKKPEAA